MYIEISETAFPVTEVASSGGVGWIEISVALATGAAAIFSGIQAIYTRRAVQLAAGQFVTSQRAFVFIDQIETLEDGDKLSGRITLTNSGATPAESTTVKITASTQATINSEIAGVVVFPGQAVSLEWLLEDGTRVKTGYEQHQMTVRVEFVDVVGKTRQYTATIDFDRKSRQYRVSTSDIN